MGYKPNLTWISSSIFEGKDKKEKLKELSGYDGIIVPGGFGSRGIEGIINAIEYAREKKIPYFGLCYGMQLMVIEYARNILGLKDADTREINPKSKNLVIDVMEEGKPVVTYGNMTPEKARKVVAEHIVNGKIVNDYVVTRG